MKELPCTLLSTEVSVHSRARTQKEFHKCERDQIRQCSCTQTSESV